MKPVLGSRPLRWWVRHVHEEAAERRSLLSPVSWLLPKNTAPPSLFISPTVPPTVSSASHLPVCLYCKHICVSPSLSRNDDLGVRAAPTPFQPWITLPCHYSVVPPARVLHVRHSGAACLLAPCLCGPVDERSSTTDAPGQWSRSSYGTDCLENYAHE